MLWSKDRHCWSERDLVVRSWLTSPSSDQLAFSRTSIFGTKRSRMVLAQRVTVSSAGVTDEDARRSSQQGIQFMMDTGLTNAVRQYNSCLPGPYLVAKGASLLDFEQWRQRQSE